AVRAASAQANPAEPTPRHRPAFIDTKLVQAAVRSSQMSDGIHENVATSAPDKGGFRQPLTRAPAWYWTPPESAILGQRDNAVSASTQSDADPTKMAPDTHGLNQR